MNLLHMENFCGKKQQQQQQKTDKVYHNVINFSQQLKIQNAFMKLIF